MSLSLGEPLELSYSRQELWALGLDPLNLECSKERQFPLVEGSSREWFPGRDQL